VTNVIASPLDMDQPVASIVGPHAAPGDPASRAVYLDPRDLLDNPRNLRGAVGDLTDLAASMVVVGILCPLVVIPVPGRVGVFQLIIGHRRKYAAIELGLSVVPCWVAVDEGEALSIVAQLAENGHRAGLSATEEAEAYHQLTLLDWTPEQIARVRAIPAVSVRQSLRLRELPEAARVAADAGTLTLDDAAAMAEFADDPVTISRILKSATSGWGFRHAVASERSRRDFAAAKERVKAELVLAGVKVTAKPKGYPYSGPAVPATNLLDAHGVRLNPEVVRTMPGFAAFVEKEGIGADAQAVVYCVDTTASATPAPCATGTAARSPRPTGSPRRKPTGSTPSTCTSCRSPPTCGASSTAVPTARPGPVRSCSSTPCATAWPTRRRCGSPTSTASTPRWVAPTRTPWPPPGRNAFVAAWSRNGSAPTSTT
jgi:ParB/RepB/Spo0J family partition protein